MFTNEIADQFKVNPKPEMNEGLLKYIDKNAYSIQPYDISKSNKLIQYLVKEYLYPYKKLLAVHVPDEKQFVLHFNFIGGGGTTSPSGKSPIFRANNDVFVYSHVGEANFIQIHDKEGYTYIFGE